MIESSINLFSEVTPSIDINIDEIIEEIRTDWKIPGLAICIIKEGKIILAKGYGYRDLKKNLEVNKETLFPIASCTKSFTALSAGIQVDKDKLDWDTPITKYLPDFQMYDPYITENITMRDLLSHRSGMPQHYRMYFNSGLSRKEIIPRIKFLEFSESFRYSFQYTNLMYMTAAYIIENISGISWEEFIHENVFSPLEMAASNFSLTNSEKTGNFSLPYRYSEGKIQAISYFKVGSMNPAGGIISNIQDLSNWLLMLCNNGQFQDKQIISKKNLDEMKTPHTRIPQLLKGENFPWSFYGLGWGIRTYKNYLLISHGGGFDGFSALISFIPEECIGIAVLTNMENSPVPSILTNTIYDLFLDLDKTDWNAKYKEIFSQQRANIKSPKEYIINNINESSIDCYIGEYFNPGYGSLFISEKKNHVLEITHNNLESIINYIEEDEFESIDEKFNLGSNPIKITFNRNRKGEIESVSIPFEPKVNNIVFIKIK